MTQIDSVLNTTKQLARRGIVSNDFYQLLLENIPAEPTARSILDGYNHVWVLDFEFYQPPGENPQPHCAVFHDVITGATKIHGDYSRRTYSPPFANTGDTLVVGYAVQAELACFLSLGWKLPRNVIDLFAEFRCRTNGRPKITRAGLYDALDHYGIQHSAPAAKKEMQVLAGTNKTLPVHQMAALANYCRQDVDLTSKLFREMWNSGHICLAQALMRGQYAGAVARIERNGIPLDVSVLQTLRDRWRSIKHLLIKDLDQTAHIYKGGAFRRATFTEWTERQGIKWPRLESGIVALDKRTFAKMAAHYPVIEPLNELRQTLAVLRKESIPVGADGCNRCYLAPYRSKTGRNQPSNSKFIFGLSAWMRCLIKPPEGMALAYIDWSQQEFGIAAVLSDDQNMIEAYRSGDPYLAFAKLAGAVSKDATGQEPAVKAIRKKYKACILGVQYGKGAVSLADELKLTVEEAVALLDSHRAAFPKYWQWVNWGLKYAMVRRSIHTVGGWKMAVDYSTNPRAVMNFPMQANGAEMLRLACCLLVDAGIKVIAPVHDACVILAPGDKVEETVLAAQLLMADASGIILKGFRLNTSATVVLYPDHYVDPDGLVQWTKIIQLVNEPTPDELLIKQTMFDFDYMLDDEDEDG